jgi:hypothetical protein
MHNLQPYVDVFDDAYPDYADEPYYEIRHLVDVYQANNACETVHSAEFARAVELIQPLIAIKNYKSQVPFPSDVVNAIDCIVEIHQMEVTLNEVRGVQAALMTRLLGIQGFRLATASAVMHFCHPSHFPIVDVNVAAACALLKAQYNGDFEGFEVPRIPHYQGNPDAVIVAYRRFISFIDRVRILQNQYGGPGDYRYIDKALMVLGDDRTRARVEI